MGEREGRKMGGKRREREGRGESGGRGWREGGRIRTHSKGKPCKNLERSWVPISLPAWKPEPIDGHHVFPLTIH